MESGILQCLKTQQKLQEHQYANLTLKAYANFVTEGVSNRRSRQETFKHNLPRQVSDTKTCRSSQGRGRVSVRERGRGKK